MNSQFPKRATLCAVAILLATTSLALTHGAFAQNKTKSGIALKKEAPSKNIKIEGVEIKGTYNARGGDVTIEGTDNRITITGTCRTLMVNGAGNIVKIASVTSIKVEGASNQVLWAKANGRKTPIISSKGVDNSIRQKS